MTTGVRGANAHVPPPTPPTSAMDAYASTPTPRLGAGRARCVGAQEAVAASHLPTPLSLLLGAHASPRTMVEVALGQRTGQRGKDRDTFLGCQGKFQCGNLACEPPYPSCSPAFALFQLGVGHHG
jgi:hypothetical protein